LSTPEGVSGAVITVDDKQDAAFGVQRVARIAVRARSALGDTGVPRELSEASRVRIRTAALIDMRYGDRRTGRDAR